MQVHKFSDLLWPQSLVRGFLFVHLTCNPHKYKIGPLAIMNAILRGADKPVYKCALSNVIDKLCADGFKWQPTEVMCDFEAAMHNAVQELWPQAHIRGCWYHL